LYKLTTNLFFFTHVKLDQPCSSNQITQIIYSSMNNYSKLSNKSPQLGTFGPNRREIESLQSGGEDRGTGVHKYRLSFM
jgi:hypothetical protein